MLAQPHRVVVLSGGSSSERDISRRSGTAIASALCEVGFETVQVDPALVNLNAFHWEREDVAFIALHGAFGEDGQVQSLLNDLRVPYTGSGADASHVCFNKELTKRRFQEAKLPTPRYVLCHQSQDESEWLETVEPLGKNLFVKPSREGSSLGITHVRSPSDLQAAIRTAHEYSETAIVEEAVIGTEWTCTVLGKRCLPAMQIIPGTDFYDFNAKYNSDKTRYQFADEAQGKLAERLDELTLEASQVIGTSGIARVDFRVDERNQPYLLEINTSPGMTEQSLVPKAARQAGLIFPEVCAWAVREGFARWQRNHIKDRELRVATAVA